MKNESFFVCFSSGRAEREHRAACGRQRKDSGRHGAVGRHVSCGGCQFMSVAPYLTLHQQSDKPEVLVGRVSRRMVADKNPRCASRSTTSSPSWRSEKAGLTPALSPSSRKNWTTSRVSGRGTVNIWRTPPSSWRTPSRQWTTARWPSFCRSASRRNRKSLCFSHPL